MRPMNWCRSLIVGLYPGDDRRWGVRSRSQEVRRWPPLASHQCRLGGAEFMRLSDTWTSAATSATCHCRSECWKTSSNTLHPCWSSDPPGGSSSFCSHGSGTESSTTSGEDILNLFMTIDDLFSQLQHLRRVEAEQLLADVLLLLQEAGPCPGQVGMMIMIIKLW